MSATTDTKCPACGQLHTFYLAIGESPSAAKHYVFTCPTTHKTTPFPTSGETWRVVPLRPQQTVMIVESNK